MSLFCATPSRSTRCGLHASGVPLLPKLRGQFAEFLDRGSPVRLGSVLPAHLRRFAVRTLHALAPELFSPVRVHALGSLRSLPHPSHLDAVVAGVVLRAGTPPCPIGRPRHPSGALYELKRSCSGAGLWTCSPSPTPRGLGLGPTNPERIILPQEPLGLRRHGFSP